jgi:hypothetical protein
MVINKKTLMFAGAVLLSACGTAQNERSSGNKTAAETETADSSKSNTADGEKKDVGKPADAGGSFALTEEDKAEVADQVEEAMESVADEVNQEDSGVNALLVRRNAEAKFQRHCDEKEDGSAVVTVERSLRTEGS